MGTSEVQKIRKCQNASSVPWVNEILINALLGFPSFLQIPDKLTLADLGCVSMPFWAFLHFYFYSHVQVECDEDCVNALLGFPSFLLKEEFEKLKIRNVSMPFWAFLHFYEIYNLPDARQKECVNALLGFPSFLHVKISNYAISKISVSMPFWAFLHFYEETLSENRLLRSVSMPFWAFLHFYKLLLKRLYRFRVVCQCPSGLSFISTKRKIIFQRRIWIVSMPFWAFLHFYLQAQVVHRNKTGMCQCPFGLSFISTASFWNPQK